MPHSQKVPKLVANTCIWIDGFQITRSGVATYGGGGSGLNLPEILKVKLEIIITMSNGKSDRAEILNISLELTTV